MYWLIVNLIFNVKNYLKQYLIVKFLIFTYNIYTYILYIKIILLYKIILYVIHISNFISILPVFNNNFFTKFFLVIRSFWLVALALITMSEADKNVEALRSVVEGANQFSSSFFQVK